MDVRKLLDFETWDEFAGITAVGQVHCPHCGRLNDPPDDGHEGVGTCQLCGQPFAWRQLDTPLGDSYMSMRLVRKGEV